MLTCTACGHTTADHADGLMGARVNDDWLCHQDDHSCYSPPASGAVIFDRIDSFLFALLDDEPRA